MRLSQICAVLFDDELFIEARFPIVKKLGEPIFTGLSCGQLPATKLVRHGQKEVVITWCEIWTIRWMQKNRPSELPDFLARHQRCVWPGVVLMANNSPSVDQRWHLLHECCIQAVQLLAVQVRIERLAIGEPLIVLQAWPPSGQPHRFSTTTVCASRCRK